ncbi:ATP-binding protein [Actinomycetospora corticicola]|uniref:Nuclease SbcCD subunit C n=1 Tax=Actinomycetospora corticicola TaxID=663602 RepID=A0A7Y9J3P4_9PSEU|nr:AAA family ATPase [Actinomycetospora corticicola]NYD34180.1 ABC-type lipoprotein export system ATPase subunit/energy-coupling factor transporter ATP-binding protein EcfA2 [Actinomycetospora corticicola]
MVEEDTSLDAEHGLLVLDALDGDTALARALGDGSDPADPEDAGPAPDDAAPTAGSYLASITVEGFRGIGEPATLTLAPGPGLTVVVGRNGSGKSSFAEAAELAVTGANRRWDGSRSMVWREGWRNLHCPDPARIAVETVGGPGGPVMVRRAWGPDDGLEAGSWTRQAHSERVAPVGSAGDAVRTYRPFLSYNELGSVVEGKPSEMHDALFTLLGLADLTAAQGRITAAKKARDQRAKAARDLRQELRTAAGELDDERAAKAMAVLTATAPDLDALGALALGDDEDVATVALLRRVTALALPAQDAVETVASQYDEAREALRDASSSQARASAGLARLLRTALDHHAAHGDEPCPVCGQGTLDATWHADAERRTREAEQGATDFDQANDRVDLARQALARLVEPVPSVLGEELPFPTAGVRTAWERWRQAPDAVDAHAAVEEAGQALRPELAAVVEKAGSELARRDEQWRPLAARLFELHGLLARVAAEKPQLTSLKKAESWLKDAASAIRDERLRPFAEQSQRIWNDLRQQSNVGLGPIRLEGSSTRRKATFDVTVDDVEGAALGVMSQGELHSLALSLFLPRATVEESPFRYVLIDDPVQAMDPAKVDGLARVLSGVARDRQVVVFSHDDRLAESVRRLQVPATVVEVVRRDRSRVELRTCSDPVVRHLEDARAMAKSDHVPDDLRGEIVASSCRSALEAAAHAAFRRSRIGKGDDRDDVEARLAAAHTTRAVLTLAVFNDPDRAGDLEGRLRSAGRGSVDVFHACKAGAHSGYPGDLGSLIAGTKTLCGWVARQ